MGAELYFGGLDMKCFEINLKDHYPVQKGTVQAILGESPHDGNSPFVRPALVVVPGGGYWFVSKREGEPVASAFLAKGFQTFILTYACAPDEVHYPEQLTELACTVDYIRRNAEAFHVNPDQIFVVGFSAGGHLTANLAVAYHEIEKITGLQLDCKPTAVGLSYPVVFEHGSSFDNLLKGYEGAEREALLPEIHLLNKVSSKTAPAFIWTTAEDKVVPPVNSLYFAAELSKNGVLFELHVYPHGHHGLSTGSREVNDPIPALEVISSWVDDCARFFREYC